MPFNEAVSRTLRSLLRPHVFHTMNQVITMRHIGHRRGLHLAMSLFTVLKGDSLPPEGQGEGGEGRAPVPLIALRAFHALRLVAPGACPPPGPCPARPGR